MLRLVLPWRCDPPSWNSGDEVVKIIEVERSAESAIENLRDGGAAELVAELDVVLAGFPGNVVDVMPVGVHALAWIAIVRAEGSETASRAANRNFGQTEIVGSAFGVPGATVFSPIEVGSKLRSCGKNPSAKRFHPSRASLTMDGEIVET